MDIYEINLVIEKKQFTKAFCTEIIYSLFEAHKEEFKDNKLEQGGRWSQSQVRNSKYLEKEIETLYYSQNMWGVDLPYPKSVTSINVVYDRKDYPIDNWYENIPKDKAVIAIRTDRPNVYWVDDPNDKWAPQIAKNINNFVKDSILFTMQYTQLQVAIAGIMTVLLSLLFQLTQSTLLGLLFLDLNWLINSEEKKSFLRPHTK